MIRGKELKKMYPRQRHIGAHELDRYQFEEKASRLTTTQRPTVAGLWTSSVDEETDTTDWKEFAKQHDMLLPRRLCYDKKESFDVDVDDDARIFTILNKKDLRSIQKRYGEGTNSETNINWEAFAKDYDAVRVSKFMSDKIPGYWDTESTAWFKQKFKEVESDDSPELAEIKRVSRLNKKIERFDKDILESKADAYAWRNAERIREEEEEEDEQ